MVGVSDCVGVGDCVGVNVTVGEGVGVLVLVAVLVKVWVGVLDNMIAAVKDGRVEEVVEVVALGTLQALSIVAAETTMATNQTSRFILVPDFLENIGIKYQS
jgi:hypothetical protein